MNQFPLRPPAASEHAVRYDWLFFAITLLTVIFTVLVGAMILYLAIRYRAGSKVDRRNPVSHNEKLEGILIAIPTILGLGIFAWSAVGYTQMRTMPKDAMEIFVIGKRWMWHVQHMNGIRENNELHVPVGTPVKLTMISQDVIHAFYIPEFRVQYHVVPGRYTQMHFTATKPGTYRLLCTMHCGTQHSEMVGFVHVMEQKEYDEWLKAGGNRYTSANLTMEQLGERIYNEKGCNNCHGVQDNERAPTLYGLYQSQRKMADGQVVTADDQYLRDSVLRPWELLTAGYDRTMAAYEGVLSEEQVLALNAYIKTLGRGGSDGARVRYEQPQRQDQTFSSGAKDAVDIANDRASAGAAQAQELRKAP